MKTKPKKDGLMKKNLMSACFVWLLAAMQLNAASEVAVWVPWYDGAGTYSNLVSPHGGVNPKDALTTVCLQFWDVQGGSLNNGFDPTQFVTWAHQNNIKALLTVFNGTASWDWGVAYQAFGNATAFSNELIDEMNAYNLDGIDIDLEGNGLTDPNEYREEFKTFIETLSGKLKPLGKQLTVCIFADAPDTKNNNAPSTDWIGDWAGKADYIHVMLYEEGGDESLPGSVGDDNQYYYSFQQEEGLKAGYSASQISMGLPAWDAGSWNQNWSTHFEQLFAINASVCIWDSKFSNGDWANSSQLWNDLKKFKNQVAGYRLTIDAVGGQVNANPSSANYAPNTQVTLTATPSAGFKFTGWSGDASGTNATVTITMTGDKSVSATFTPINGDQGFDMLAEGSWDTFVDNMGSTVTINQTDDAVATSWTLAKLPDEENYPYLGVSAAADTGSFVGLTSITITYTASKAVYINLTDPVLAENGACFQNTLAASSSPKTVTLTPSMFKQNPNNVETPGTLDLSKIVSIDFEPGVDPSTSGPVSGDFSITALKVNGTTLKSISNATLNRLHPVAINAAHIRSTSTGLLFSNLSGVRQIMVFDAIGRVMASVQPRASAVHVPLVKSSGILLVSIRGTDGSSVTQRIMR
jgi:uncharacterized repeat protein (TIGR02543 family)